MQTLLVLLSLALGPLALAAEPCADLSGDWQGECVLASDDASEPLVKSLTVMQEGCDEIAFIGRLAEKGEEEIFKLPGKDSSEKMGRGTSEWKNWESAFDDDMNRLVITENEKLVHHGIMTIKNKREDVFYLEGELLKREKQSLVVISYTDGSEDRSEETMTCEYQRQEEN